MPGGGSIVVVIGGHRRYTGLVLLLITYDDIYIPELAGPLLEGLRGLSEEEGAVTITLWAYEAECELMRN